MRDRTMSRSRRERPAGRGLRVGVAAALLAGCCAAGQADTSGMTTADGVYTKDQAKSGEDLYETHCLTCHDKSYFRPVLRLWKGQSAAVLFDVMAGSMPESNPGGLLDEEYLDVLAYIFSRSRYPAGNEPLVMENLGRITIRNP
jgi:mono/diheme cytochrome c family protein